MNYVSVYYQRFFILLLIFSCFNFSSESQTFPSGFSATNIGSGWNSPVGTAFDRTGNRLFVWEKGGKVFVCNWNGSTYVKQSTAVLDISPEVGNWRDHGMLGFALDPDFDNNGLIYVLYVVDRHYLINFGTAAYNAATNQYNAATIGRITRYKTITSSGNLVSDLSTRTILLGESKSTGFPVLYESHGIGALAFAADGTLLATCGDGASYNVMDPGNISHTYQNQAITDGIIRANENVGSFRSQMINSHNGKMVRIDPVTGNGVPSNPYYNPASPRSAASRVWALGLRNPFRFSVRPNTGSSNPSTGDIGEIYVGDVGWSGFEEFTIIKAPASNCGWPLFEGITVKSDYYTASATTYNKDEPNPLYGISGCTQQFFSFRNLIKQATADNITNVFNPCNSSVLISGGNSNRFFHRVPAIDWKHGTDSARVKKFTGNTLAVAQIGSATSGVTGTAFRGNAAVGGSWYTGDMFPPSYRNTYFAADYGGSWLKNFSIEFTDEVKHVNSFSSGWTAIVCITENPLDGSMVIVDLGSGLVKKVVYGGNQPPVVQMNSDKLFGPAALAVNFTGNTSYDPEGGTLTYSWDFGDGTTVSTDPNPSHIFTAPDANPKKIVVKLTVRDSVNAASTDSIIISVNNTPPNVSITSPANNMFYNVGIDTVYTLQADVTDAEHPSDQLFYLWQTSLRHDNHEHPEPLDTNKITSDLISRLGCNGDNYSWFIKLTVTDAAGLASIDSVKLLPQCGGPLPLSLLNFAVAVRGNTNLLSWTTADEKDLADFEIQRSYNGRDFESIGTVASSSAAGINNYEFKDNSFLDGYIYYRLKMNDRDGKFSNSFIVRVLSGSGTNNEITVSPNPFKNEFLLAAMFNSEGKIALRFVDTKGAVVKFVGKKVVKGFNSFIIEEARELAEGVYFLEVKQGNDVRKTKIIKIK